MNKTLKRICSTVRLMTVATLGIFITPGDFQILVSLVVSLLVSIHKDTIRAR